MCTTTRRRATLAVPPAPVSPHPPGTLTSPGALSQIQPNTAPGGTGTAKMTTMPLPANDHLPKDVRAVTRPLFSSPNFLALEQVRQAPNISNCPVAAILAAHAFTAVGRKFIIQSLLSETPGNVLTDISALPPNTLENPPPGTTISSSRYFTVKLLGGPLDVSDVLYTNDTDDANFSLIYMSDPGQQSIWAAIIEKALAVQLGTYDKFDIVLLTANDWWERITSVRPNAFAITAATPLSQIITAAQASTTLPTIGASKDNLPLPNVVTAFHGYAMIGMQDSKIHLYDPAEAIKLLLTPTEFRQKFQTILFAP